MKSKNFSNSLYLYLLLVIFAFFSLSCARNFGTHDMGQSDSSSRLPPTQTTTTTTPVSGDLASCNGFKNSFLSANFMVYFDQSNKYHPELLQMKIPTIDANFTAVSTSTTVAIPKYEIFFRKWKADLAGNTYIDPSTLTIQAQSTTNNTALYTQPLGSLKWDTFSTEVQSSLKFNPLNTDSFKNFRFVINLKDFDASYDVLRMTILKDGAIFNEVDVLIPAFYADPTIYSKNQNSVLSAIHPLINSSSAAFAKDYFLSFCF